MEYEYTTSIDTLTERSESLERFQMSNKDWELRFNAERAGLENQIQQLKQHHDEKHMSNITQAKEIKRLDLISTERLIEIEKLKQKISNAQHTQREYEEMTLKFEEAQNGFYVLYFEKNRICNKKS